MLEKKYFDDWEGSGYQELLKDFDIAPSVVADWEILFAAYCYENYSGDAIVLLERDGKLLEVHGSHCSCYGLSENWYSRGSGSHSQWDPEEASWEELSLRAEKTYGLYDGSKESLEVLRELIKKHAHSEN